MKYIMFIPMFLLSGCASFTSPTNEIRITEFGTGILPGQVGGCRIIQEGKVDAEILYEGEKCRVYKAP